MNDPQTQPMTTSDVVHCPPATDHWTKRLVELHACADAVKWAINYPSLQAAWDACERDDWMLWLCGKFTGKPWSERLRRRRRTCCAGIVRKHYPIAPNLEDKKP